MNTSALTAVGILLAAFGATLIYFFAIRRRATAEGFLSQDVHIERDALHETVDIHSERLAPGEPADPQAPARREAIGFLGFLALIDGFFLQFIAAIEAFRIGRLLP